MPRKNAKSRKHKHNESGSDNEEDVQKKSKKHQKKIKSEQRNSSSENEHKSNDSGSDNEGDQNKHKKHQSKRHDSDNEDDKPLIEKLKKCVDNEILKHYNCAAFDPEDENVNKEMLERHIKTGKVFLHADVKKVFEKYLKTNKNTPKYKGIKSAHDLVSYFLNKRLKDTKGWSLEEGRLSSLIQVSIQSQLFNTTNWGTAGNIDKDFNGTEYIPVLQVGPNLIVGNNGQYGSEKYMLLDYSKNGTNENKARTIGALEELYGKIDLYEEALNKYKDNGDDDRYIKVGGSDSKPLLLDVQAYKKYFEVLASTLIEDAKTRNKAGKDICLVITGVGLGLFAGEANTEILGMIQAHIYKSLLEQQKNNCGIAKIVFHGLGGDPETGDTETMKKFVKSIGGEILAVNNKIIVEAKHWLDDDDIITANDAREYNVMRVIAGNCAKGPGNTIRSQQSWVNGDEQNAIAAGTAGMTLQYAMHEKRRNQKLLEIVEVNNTEAKIDIAQILNLVNMDINDVVAPNINDVDSQAAGNDEQHEQHDNDMQNQVVGDLNTAIAKYTDALKVVLDNAASKEFQLQDENISYTSVAQILRDAKDRNFQKFNVDGIPEAKREAFIALQNAEKDLIEAAKNTAKELDDRNILIRILHFMAECFKSVMKCIGISKSEETTWAENIVKNVKEENIKKFP